MFLWTKNQTNKPSTKMQPLKSVKPPKSVQDKLKFYDDLPNALENVKKMREMLAKYYNITDSGPDNMYELVDPTDQQWL